MNQSFASQGSAAPKAIDLSQAVFSSRVVTTASGDEERISVMIGAAGDEPGPVAVGLHNHTAACAKGNEQATLGFTVGDGDGEGFVQDLLEAYQTPPETIEALLFGWFYSAMAAHRVEYDSNVDAAFLAHLRANGEVSPEHDRPVDPEAN